MGLVCCHFPNCHFDAQSALSVSLCIHGFDEITWCNDRRLFLFQCFHSSLSEEEKTSLRAGLITNFNEPVNQVSVCYFIQSFELFSKAVSILGWTFNHHPLYDKHSVYCVNIKILKEKVGLYNCEFHSIFYHSAMETDIF